LEIVAACVGMPLFFAREAVFKAVAFKCGCAGRQLLSAYKKKIGFMFMPLSDLVSFWQQKSNSYSSVFLFGAIRGTNNPTMWRVYLSHT
jgi:hypothetical protein